MFNSINESLEPTKNRRMTQPVDPTKLNKALANLQVSLTIINYNIHEMSGIPVVENRVYAKNSRLSRNKKDFEIIN